MIQPSHPVYGWHDSLSDPQNAAIPSGSVTAKTRGPFRDVLLSLAGDGRELDSLIKGRFGNRVENTGGEQNELRVPVVLLRSDLTRIQCLACV